VAISLSQEKCGFSADFTSAHTHHKQTSWQLKRVSPSESNNFAKKLKTSKNKSRKNVPRSMTSIVRSLQFSLSLSPPCAVVVVVVFDCKV
jgi:hypothetical protein